MEDRNPMKKRLRILGRATIVSFTKCEEVILTDSQGEKLDFFWEREGHSGT